MGDVVVLPVIRVEREPGNQRTRDAIAFYFEKILAGDRVSNGVLDVPLSDPDLFLAWLAEQGFQIVEVWQQ